MRLLNHHLIRHPAFAVFLILCLPAQSLAAVLIECKQHLQSLSSVQADSNASDLVGVQTVGGQTVVADCHGASANTVNSTNAQADNASHQTNNPEPAKTADANGCFHCSGVCQNLKPFNLAETSQQAQLFDASAFSRIAPYTATGVYSHPSRPPCPRIRS